MSDLNNIYQDTEQKMKKAIDTLTKELAKIRTGRAHPSLLDGVQLEYYNQRTPIIRLASITVEDAKTLTIAPFDKNSLVAIEKAIIAANLGINPIVVGTVIKAIIPQLTEDRRKALVKQVKIEIEAGKVAIRNIRRDANVGIKSLVTAKTISLNEKEAAENKIQKLTDKHIEQIDKIASNKEADLMKV